MLTRKGARLFALALALAALSIAARSAPTVEWTLRVAVDGARIRWQPDAGSPAVAIAARGAALKSYARLDGWFRVAAEPGRGGFVVLGYIAAADVEVVEETGPPPDVWKQVAGEFRGSGLGLRIGGGGVFFGGGDFEAGQAGMFDRTFDMAESYGAVVEDFEKNSIGAGLQLAADLAYRLARSWSCGLRFEYWRSRPDNFIRVHYRDLTHSYTAWSSIRTSVFAIGANAYYDHPLGRAFALTARGGPALYIADFQYARDLVHPAGEDAVSITANALGVGVQGGLALEWRLHRRAALFIEAQGCLAKIKGFEGDESHFWSMDFQSWREKTEGTVYLQEGDGPARLIVRGEGAAEENGLRRAALSLSGIGFAAGFRVRF